LADVIKQTELEIPNLHKALNVGGNTIKKNLKFDYMKQKNKNKFFNLSVGLVTFSIILFGCLKKDNFIDNQSQTYQELQKEFFNTSTTNDIEIKKLAEDIKKQDSLFKFLPNFVKKNGVPKWDKVLYKTKSNLTRGGQSIGLITTNSSNSTTTNTTTGNTNKGIFFIPLKSQNSNEIKSYITAYKHNDSLYTYRLYNKDSLNSIQAGTSETKRNLQTTQAVFGYFEKSVNNNDSINITKPTNSTIKNVSISFDNPSVGNNTVSNSFPTSGSCDVTISVTVIYNLVAIYDEWGNLLAGQITVSVTMNITIDCNGGGGGGPSGIGSSGGTGGTGVQTGGGSGGTSTGGGNNWWYFGTGYPWYTQGGSGGYDPNWNWWWTSIGYNPISPTISSLSSALSLSNSQVAWLNSNSHLAGQILNYLQNTSNPQANSIAIEHLNKMISDNNYNLFVNNHFQSGNSSSVWWEDDIWLDNPNNINFDITRANNQYDKLTADEKALVKIYPIAAYSIKENVQEAFDMSEARYGPDGGLNDKKDAFRHAFFNAINTRDVISNINSIPVEPSSSIVRKFGIAHESEVPAQLLLEKQMDLHNNEKGISYCSFCVPLISTNENVADAIIDILDNGHLYYLKPVLTKFQDPNFNGAGGISDPKTATHGIIPSTKLTPTNK
jgi:hypothetical protein